MAEILGFFYAVALIVLGATGLSWWLVLGAAILGTALYLMLRPSVLVQDVQDGRMASSLAVYYAAQVATAALLFGMGRAVGLFL